MTRLIAACGLLMMLLCGTASAQPAIIVLDASGSMWGRVEDRTKIAIARDVVAGLMSNWATNRPVGLMAYGHRRAGDCADIELIAPPARDAAAVTAAAARLTPRGRTPMAEAIRQAAAAIGDSGGSVILVSDGIETCHPDPCAVAQELARNGTRLVVHTVGFALGDPAALAQLRCMAEATGGRALTARDAGELAEALSRAAAAPTPGPRASAPRAEPVPQPRLIVTLRLCAGCDPMTGDATITLRRGEEVVATDGDPFGRFFDLPAGDYTVQAQTWLFERPAVPVTIPETGIGRAEIILDAGWLVGDVRSEPSGQEVTDRTALEWHAGPQVPEDQRRAAEAQNGSPAFLVPTGQHRLRARLGNAAGEAEGTVAAGETVVLRVPIQVGTLLLTRQGFGTDAPRVTITRVEDDEGVYDEWPSGAVAEIPLAPGRYRVAGDHEGRQGSTEIEVESEERLEATLSVAE